MLTITLVSFVLCFAIERIFASWRLPKVHSWYTRVVLINVAQLGVVLLAGVTWERWLSSPSIFHLSRHLGDWSAGFVAYFIATFVFYWWHRFRHESDFLWRTFHQIHHSAQRLEVITSFYKHPLEMIVNSILGSLIIYTILGLSLEAGAIYTLFTALGEFFYHTNIKTPQWVGYIFQRPEMHRIHHQYGYHKNNYGDFAIWDMLFGTYENPKTWSNRCGFDEPRELRLKEMLQLKDVHKAPKPSHLKAESVVAEGDLIFLDIPSFLFRRVAESTKSWTSHVGIVLKDENGKWVVSESKIPLSKQVPLQKFLRRSANGRFEIRRLIKPLNQLGAENLRQAARSNHGKLYGLGFKLNSCRLFCSKHVYESYRAAGVEVGRVQTFNDLLANHQRSSSLNFWRAWFLGFIPWHRRTITPASQLNDPKFFTVLRSENRSSALNP